MKHIKSHLAGFLVIISFLVVVLTGRGVDLSAANGDQQLGILAMERSYSNPESLLTVNRIMKRLKKLLTGQDSLSDWVRPMGIACREHLLAVVDAGDRKVFLIDRNHKKTVEIVPSDGLVSPIDVTLSDTSLFVSDSATGFVWEYSLEHKTWTRLPDTFSRPTGLCFDESRRCLFIVDTIRHSVYTWDGRSMALFCNDGLNFPTDVAVSKERVFIANSMDHEIEIRFRDGKRDTSFGQAGDGMGAFSFIRGIALDAQDRIYITDVHQDWIQVYSISGKLLYVHGGVDNLHFPTYLSWCDNKLWVSDSLAHRIVEFRTP